MSLLFNLTKNNTNRINVLHNFIPSLTIHDGKVISEINEDEFKPLNLKHVKGQVAPRRARRKIEPATPREKLMAVDQDWGNVWPGPRTFHPATVPLPLHQGFVEKGAAPGKYVNLELMKIPNFLHLTPPVIKRQCEALKKFCTPWPKELTSDEECEKHFPLEVIYTTYCHSSPSIRDPLARIVSVRIKVSNLKLDAHAKDKLLRLVGERYNEETDLLTIVTDRCPTSKQNYEYAMFLLTALYFESWKVESWEELKTEIDMKYYEWEKSDSQKNLIELLQYNNIDENRKKEFQPKYGASISSVWNGGESNQSISKYGEVVRQILNLPQL